jgi:3-oxoacyl-[acyl-carrier-protein] synthase-3
MNDVFITNFSVALPNEAVTNDEIEQVLGMVGGKPSRARRIVLRNNGIKARYYALDKESGEITHTNAQLTAEAIQGLVSKNFSIDQIECLATGSTTPDQLMPNHGLMVHGELDIKDCEVIATSGICLAGMTALKFAYLGVRADEYQSAVATGSETASHILRARHFKLEAEHMVEELEQQPILAFHKDFLRWMLSDGAGAALLQSKPNSEGISLRIDWLKCFSYANEIETCMYAGAEKQADGSLNSWLNYSSDEVQQNSILSPKQDVKLLNNNIIRYTVEKPLEELVPKFALKADDFDYFLPHISSCYFKKPLTEGLARAGLPIPEERWFTNLVTKGNTGAASIYIMLDELFHSGQLKPGERLLCFIPESGRFSASFMQLTVV